MHSPTHPAVDPRQIYHAYGETVLERYHASFGVGNPDSNFPLPNGWSKKDAPPRLAKTTPIHHVAIVGAGVAGLHAATILGKHFKVDVFEASKRIGGRLYTHKFDNVSAIGTPSPGGEYDYFVSLTTPCGVLADHECYRT
jgi:NADPH-dependent 2,4-dienoyl-CoA reductase/sulfur reductase-like enzyme